MNPALGKNHDRGWKRVCRQLGGDDSTRHSLTFGTKPVKAEYIYVCQDGHEVDIGAIRHRKLQAGSVRSYTVRGHGAIFRTDLKGVKQPTAPKQEAVAKPAPRQPAQNGSKAAIAREYLQNELATASKEFILLETAMHVERLFKLCGFGTRSAARSCFIANLNKLA